MNDLKKLFRELLVLEDACVDEHLVQVITDLIESLMRFVGTIFANHNGIHATEFDALMEKELTEIKRKINEIKKVTFEDYRRI